MDLTSWIGIVRCSVTCVSCSIGFWWMRRKKFGESFSYCIQYFRYRLWFSSLVLCASGTHSTFSVFWIKKNRDHLNYEIKIKIDKCEISITLRKKLDCSLNAANFDDSIPISTIAFPNIFENLNTYFAQLIYFIYYEMLNAST